MYSPQYAVISDQNTINEVISANPFATIAYQEEGRLESFHLPLLFI